MFNFSNFNSKVYCFFCHGKSHISQFCDIHKSNESRLKVLDSRRCCKQCLQPEEKSLQCFQCYYKYKPMHSYCYNCFSYRHHTIFCPNALIEYPKIDKMLHLRFVQLLTPADQNLLVQSETMKLINLLDNDIKQLEIFVINGENKPVHLGHLSYQPAVLIIKNAKMKPSNLKQLLSPALKVLRCSRAIFAPKITFSNVLKCCPNIQELELLNSGIEMENTWIENLKTYATNLKKFSVSLKHLDFDVENLAMLLKDKQIEISIFVDLDDKIDVFLNKQISAYFNQVSTEKSNGSLLCFIAKSSTDGKHIYSKRFQPI